MNTGNHYGDISVMGGWFCGKCGAFVPNNQNHECSLVGGSTDKIEFGRAESYLSDRDLLLKILEKLDEILKELKK